MTAFESNTVPQFALGAARLCVGTVVSDDDTPTYETVRIKLKANSNIKPGALLTIPVGDGTRTLIARVRSAYEHNPYERAADVTVRDALGLGRSYPREEDSTTIFRLAQADLIEEIVDGGARAPESLPAAGTDVFTATRADVAASLGLAVSPAVGLDVGETADGTGVQIILRREILQRHVFIGGTTGSGKSYAMTVLSEEILKHGLPIVFIDTQGEYSNFVARVGGTVVTPGQDFTIRISSLTDGELLDLVPTDSQLQRDIISAAFLELQDELRAEKIMRFTVDDLAARVAEIGPKLTNSSTSVDLAVRRTRFIKRLDIFGDGVERANWPRLMMPCVAIRCSHLTQSRLQALVTAVLRELQELRIRGHVPPYVAVLDEAHLFVPDHDTSPCKQIIREGVRIGRHHGICMILITQSPVDIDKRAIRQCNTRLIFALEQDQLESIRGVKSDASDEMLRALPKLPRGSCIISGTHESIRHAIPVRIRQRRTAPEMTTTPDVFAETQKWDPRGKRRG